MEEIDYTETFDLASSGTEEPTGKGTSAGEERLGGGTAPDGEGAALERGTEAAAIPEGPSPPAEEETGRESLRLQQRRQEAEMARNAFQQAALAHDEERVRLKIEEQMRQIRELDPRIRGAEDLRDMPNYPQFYELVKKGNDLVDAYKLANFDTLTQASAAASRQAAINSVNSLSHLRRVSEHGRGAQSVPADVKDLYRVFNPDASDAEIQAHWNRQKR